MRETVQGFPGADALRVQAHGAGEIRAGLVAAPVGQEGETERLVLGGALGSGEASGGSLV